MTGVTNKYAKPLLIGAYVFFLSVACHHVWGQDNDKDLIRVNGLIMDADNREELPSVNIYVKDSFFGTVSDIYGHFSLLMHAGDTLIFSYVGYRDGIFIMPEKLDRRNYTVLQLMRKSTVMLEELVVFPWPDIQNFKDAFMEVQPPRNFDDMTFEVQRDISKLSKEEYDRNKYYYEQMRYNKVYDLHGLIPPNHFLNPFYWSNFVRDIKAGKVKK